MRSTSGVQYCSAKSKRVADGLAAFKIYASIRNPAHRLPGPKCTMLPGETTVMRALPGYPTRALALTALAVIAGTVFARGQSSTATRSSVAPARAKVINLIPASLSGETNQDSEPFLAVQSANPQLMVASAFTPNPISNTDRKST